ncbi:hypothetical protein Scep_030231 [Stephania cephalantha]|uniref:Uncharacterized protein n=1 Tax=Stephania cephalantha TaxID=152367 RepID=A0AAP0HIE9_9MAGN
MRASRAATAKGESFRCSDGRRRGLRRQRRQRAKASEAATADDTTSDRPDDNSQSQSQRRQRPQPPTDGAEISGLEHSKCAGVAGLVRIAHQALAITRYADWGR